MSGRRSAFAAAVVALFALDALSTESYVAFALLVALASYLAGRATGIGR